LFALTDADLMLIPRTHAGDKFLKCEQVFMRYDECVWCVYVCMQSAYVTSVSCWRLQTCTMLLNSRQLVFSSLLLTCQLCLSPGCAVLHEPVT